MGCYCSLIDDIKYELSKDIQGKVICCKCQDRFKPHYGCKSERNSCRQHNYVIWEGELFCIDCNKSRKEIRSRNCYHKYS